MAAPRVLLVDDHIGDITWLVDLLESRGYEVDNVTDEETARGRLEAVKEGRASYALAVIDIMVSIQDIRKLAALDEEFFRESKRTGIRLCELARRRLRLSESDLPIVCISARSDHEEIIKPLDELGVRVFSRVPQSREDSIRGYLEQKLPRVGGLLAEGRGRRSAGSETQP